MTAPISSREPGPDLVGAGMAERDEDVQRLLPGAGGGGHIAGRLVGVAQIGDPDITNVWLAGS